MLSLLVVEETRGRGVVPSRVRMTRLCPNELVSPFSSREEIGSEVRFPLSPLPSVCLTVESPTDDPRTCSR